MKKVAMILSILVLFITNSFAQENWKWELTDSTAKTKTQLYADTKLFIAEAWNSAKDVIQNDDKETGVVLVKGLTDATVNSLMTSVTYWFSYTAKFQMKDGKYRITIDNLSCSDVTTTSTSPFAPLSLDGYRGAFKDGLTEKNYNKVIEALKLNITNLVAGYQTAMKKPLVADNF